MSYKGSAILLSYDLNGIKKNLCNIKTEYASKLLQISPSLYQSIPTKVLHMPVTKRRIIISKSENEYESNSNADSEANIDHDS